MTHPTACQPAYGLAFETSGLSGSVALGRGAEILMAQPFPGPRKHAVAFLPTVDALCRACRVAPAQIRRVHVSAGPGSFTGLRIGVTAARMIALATGARIVAVPTLEAIAQNATDVSEPPDRVVVILDARRSRVYAALFAHRQGRYVPETQPVEADPAAFLAPLESSCAVMGEGVACYRPVVEASGLRILPETVHLPRCETVYRLGHARAERGALIDPRHLTPIYVRPPEAEERWAQRRRKENDSKPTP